MVMMVRLTEGLYWFSALGCGLIAGVFYAFSSFVMPALSRLPAVQGVLAMQEINRMALTRPFLVVFVGTALSCVLLAVLSALDLSDARARWRLVSCAAYLVGTFLLTIAYHVPRNEALDRVDATSLEAAARWGAYLAEWVPGNHARAGAALLGLIGLMLGR
jgi:uncharacterized membrane protein